MKKIIILLVGCFLFIQCTKSNPTKTNIPPEGSIEGIISTDQLANLKDLQILIIPKNPQFNTLELSPDSTGYFKQTGIVNGNYQIVTALYSFEEYRKDFTVNGNNVNFNIMLHKVPFNFKALGGGCEYFYWYEYYTLLYFGDMGKRLVYIESNYEGIIKKATSTIIDTAALDGISDGGRFTNSNGDISYGECLFGIGCDTLEIIDFGASGVEDSTDSRILRPGLKITIKTEFNGFYFNKENPDSNDLIPFTSFCFDTTTVKERQ
jgi:hypothetical protein